MPACVKVMNNPAGVNVHTLMSLAIEKGNLEILKLFQENSFKLYNASRFQRPLNAFNIVDKFEIYFVYSLLLYKIMLRGLAARRKGQNDPIFDFFIQPAVFEYVAPLVLFHATHNEDRDMIRFLCSLDVKTLEGKSAVVAALRPENELSAHQLSLFYRSCEEWHQKIVQERISGLHVNPEHWVELPKQEDRNAIEMTVFEDLLNAPDWKEFVAQNNCLKVRSTKVKEPDVFPLIFLQAIESEGEFKKCIEVLKILRRSDPDIVSSVKEEFIKLAVYHNRQFLALLLQNEDIISDCQGVSIGNLGLESILVKNPEMVDSIAILLAISSKKFSLELYKACLQNENDAAKKIKEILLQNFSSHCKENTADLWHITFRYHISGSHYEETMISLFDYLKEKHLETLKSKNSLGMNLLMHIINKERDNNEPNRDNILVSHMIDSKVFDVNDVATVLPGNKYWLQHNQNITKPSKQTNTVLDDEPYSVKEVVAQNEEGKYEQPRTKPGQTKYISKEPQHVETVDLALNSKTFVFVRYLRSG